MHVAIDIPDNIFFAINETEQSLAERMKEKLALELYASHQITLTQATKMLSKDIYTFMALASKHNIPLIDDYDIAEEVATAQRLLK